MKKPIRLITGFEVSGRSLVLRFRAAANTRGLKRGRFSLRINGRKLRIKGRPRLARDRRSITLRLAANTRAGDKLLLRYRDPRGDQKKGVIQNRKGRDARSFRGRRTVLPRTAPAPTPLRPPAPPPRVYAPIELSKIAAGSGGFVINGETTNDLSGRSVSAAGDVNGDGLADLIIGADGADPNGLASGRSYVVFGKAATGPVNLSAITRGSGGFVINGETAVDFSGGSVSAAGDVNGDGLADLIIGAYRADPNGSASGRSYVVFGKAATGPVNLSAITRGSGGFVINGETTNDLSGRSVSCCRRCQRRWPR